MAKDNISPEQKALLNLESKYRTRMWRIYNSAADEAAKLGIGIDAAELTEEMFSFENFPQTKKRINDILRNLHDDVQTNVISGAMASWQLANKKNDELVNAVFGDKVNKLTDAQKRQYFNNNSQALETFLSRKVNGMDLSKRVWNYTDIFKQNIEAVLDAGIREGKSASEMATSLKQYLKYPDKLFRRVRGEDGKLHLSKAAKAFHPGQGIYRSSYMNALRMSATENNIAYRTSDYLRIQGLDFVVGIRIRLSNNHTLKNPQGGAPLPLHDICDELQGIYPKTFKFTGWHPFCRCHQETVLKTEQEMNEDTQRMLQGGSPTQGSSKAVNDVPAAFSDWISENKDRIKNARNMPYFLSDNESIYKSYFDSKLKSREHIRESLDYNLVKSFFTEEEKSKFFTSVDRIFTNKYDAIQDDTARLLGKDKFGTVFNPKGEIIDANVANIHPCQPSINAKNVIKISESISNEGLKEIPTALKIRDDLYLLDGHHRIAAEIIAGKNKVSLRVVEIPLEEWKKAYKERSRKSVLEIAKERHAARTPEQIADIRKRLFMRDMVENIPKADKEKIAENWLEIEKVSGKKKGRKMSIDDADKQSANPNYKQKGGNINCATCAPCYSLRVAGFDFTAKVNTPSNALNRWMSENENMYKVWKNTDGTAAKYTSVESWLKSKGYSRTMDLPKWTEFFDDNCKEEGIYLMSIGWTATNGHATIIQKFADGTISYIEPQLFMSFLGVKQKIQNLVRSAAKVQSSGRGIMRIDNKIFDTAYISIFDK